MTRVQQQFKLAKLDPDLMPRLANLASIYGILRLDPHTQPGELIVEFDATRLKEKDVEAALARAGIPVLPLT